MEINKSSKEESGIGIENPEGSIVNSRRPEIQLYLDASSLNLKSDSFYESANDRLTRFIEEAEECDKEFIEGLVCFLSDNGIKLSPVVLLSVLSSNGMSFRGKDFTSIFNVPERIAEAIALENNNYLTLNNSFKKNVLKESLGRFESYTLRKHKMLKRKVKLKDLIKMLHPVPKDKATSKLYKSIIEDTKLSKMKEDETFVRVKSSDMSDAKKKKYFEENIDKIPLNEFIRNLRFITDNYDFKKNYELQKKVIKRLKSIDEEVYRFFNVFDLIETSIHVPALEKALFEVILDFVKKINKKFEYDEKEATVLFDVSGSMDPDGIDKGFRYLVMFALLMNKSRLRLFSSNLLEEDYTNILNDIRKGNISKAYSALKEVPKGGTALLNSVKELKDIEKIPKTFIVISDEVSWVEGKDLRSEINEVADLLKSHRVIVINPVVYGGTVMKKNLLAISSLTSATIYNMLLTTNPDKFIRYIKDYNNKTKRRIKKDAK